MEVTSESSQMIAELLAASIFHVQRERARGRESFFRVAWPPESLPATVFVNMRTVEKSCIPQALAVVAATVVFSHELSATPGLQVAFWSRLLRIQFGWGNVLMGVERWLPSQRSRQQLRVVLDYTELGEMSGELESSLEQFLTAPVGAQELSTPRVDDLDELDASIWSIAELFIALSRHPDRSAVIAEFLQRALTHPTASRVPFEVGLLLSAKYVRTTRRLLDNLAAKQSPQLSVASLDLRSGSVVLDTEMMNNIIDIVERNHLVYHIGDLRLDRIQVHGSSASADASVAQRRRLLLAVFQPPPTLKAAPLERLSLASGLYCVAHFEAVCSALRYGCPYAELSLVGLLNSVTDQIQRSQCWQWIAFGVFHPRSSACASEKFQLRKVDMTGTLLNADDVDAFVAALRDPSRVLLAGRGGTVDEFALRVCAASAGTKIYSSPDHTSRVVYELYDSQSLEALGSRGDWLCVVVAGVGLAWMPQDCGLGEGAADTVTRPKETLACDSLAPQLHLIASVRDARPLFFEAIVPYLRSLDVRDEPGSLAVACSQNSHLKHLDVVNCYLPDDEVVSVLRELGGSLGEHLESLSMSWRALLSANAVDQLIESLSESRQSVRLRELRLIRGKPTAQELAKLYDMLNANQTLRLLELEALPRMEQVSEYDDQRLLLEAAFQGVKVRSDSLGIAEKLAFLSVVAARGSGMMELDPLPLSLVFEFAATDVRREIVWVGLIQ